MPAAGTRPLAQRRARGRAIHILKYKPYIIYRYLAQRSSCAPAAATRMPWKDRAIEPHHLNMGELPYQMTMEELAAAGGHAGGSKINSMSLTERCVREPAVSRPRSRHLPQSRTQAHSSFGAARTWATRSSFRRSMSAVQSRSGPACGLSSPASVESPTTHTRARFLTDRSARARCGSPPAVSTVF